MNYFKVSKFFLFLPVLAVAIVLTSTLFPFIVGKYVLFRTSVDLALIFFLLGIVFSPQAEIYKEKLLKLVKNPLVIAVTVFAFIFLLACFFGVNPANSFWSNFERGEGGLQLTHLWLFFILLVVLFQKESDWQKIFGWALVGGLLMAAYGLFAGLGIKGFIGPAFGSPSFRFQGSIGNPAYVAAYSIFMMFYASYLLISRSASKFWTAGNIFKLALIAVFFAVFILAATRGAFLGFIASVFAFLVFFAFSCKNWRKTFLTGGAVLILLVIILVYFKDTPFVKAIPGSRIFDISFSTQTFQDRRVIWQIAWDGFKERPVLGWGPENFIDVFDQKFNIEYFRPPEAFGAWFDRAHSVFFDYLAETGILGLLSYLGIFVVYYWQIFKHARIDTDKQRIDADKSKNIHIDQSKSLPAGRQEHKSALMKAWFFALLVAYLVQGLVLFDVLVIYINLFLVLAFSVSYFNFLNPPLAKNKR